MRMQWRVCFPGCCRTIHNKITRSSAAAESKAVVPHQALENRSALTIGLCCNAVHYLASIGDIRKAARPACQDATRSFQSASNAIHDGYAALTVVKLTTKTGTIGGYAHNRLITNSATWYLT
jgi:hypothetical protein